MIDEAEAQILALQGLAWLGRTDDMLDHFTRSSGMSRAELAGRIDDPDLLASVLDFLLLDDDWIRAFAAEADIAPEKVAAARAALSGGTAPHWT